MPACAIALTATDRARHEGDHSVANRLILIPVPLHLHHHPCRPVATAAARKVLSAAIIPTASISTTCRSSSSRPSATPAPSDLPGAVGTSSIRRRHAGRRQAVAVVLCVAAVSWHVIEKPVLSLRRFALAGRVPGAGEGRATMASAAALEGRAGSGGHRARWAYGHAAPERFRATAFPNLYLLSTFTGEPAAMPTRHAEGSSYGRRGHHPHTADCCRSFPCESCQNACLEMLLHGAG